MSGRRVVLLALAALVVIAAALFLSSHREASRTTVVGAAILPDLASQLENIQQIRLTRGDTSTTLVRGSDGWTVGERSYAADVGRIRKLLLDLADLKLLEEKTGTPANYPALGVEDPNAPGAGGTLIELRDAAGNRALIVGKPAGNDGSYVRVQGQPASALARPQIMVEARPAAWLDRQLLDISAERVQSVTRARGKAKPAAVEDGVKAQLAALTFDDVRAATTTTPDETLVLTTTDGLTVDIVGRRDADHRFVTIAARSAADAKPEIAAQAMRLTARGNGREFELPAYRYESLFPPPPEPAAKKVNAIAR